jgi:hypothetical protein
MLWDFKAPPRRLKFLLIKNLHRLIQQIDDFLPRIDEPGTDRRQFNEIIMSIGTQLQIQCIHKTSHPKFRRAIGTSSLQCEKTGGRCNRYNVSSFSFDHSIEEYTAGLEIT